MHTDSLGDNYEFAIDLAKGLIGNGYEVVLAVTGITLTDLQKAELEQFEHYFAEFKPEWMENPWGDVKQTGKWLLKLSEKVKPDVVHLNSYALGSLQWKVPVLIVFHSCMLSWWKALFDKPVPIRWTKYRQMVEQGLKNADLVTFQTHSMFNEANRLYGPFKKYLIIPNGKSSYAYHSDVKEKYIFSSGHLWDDSKNMDMLLKAATGIFYPIYIEGDNRHAKTDDLPANVFCTGPLTPSQRADWLSNAFICLLPSKYEPFGYILLEAAFSKCALIGNNISTLREIWNDAILYFQTTDELIETTNRMMQNTELLFLYGQKAYERALENYTTEKMTRHYMEVYRQLSRINIDVRI